MHFRMSDVPESGQTRNISDNPHQGRRCSYCSKPISAPDAPLPFCCVRCQQLDLANWLDEEYGLPWEGENDTDEIEET